VEIALVAVDVDAAHRIAVDAGCEHPFGTLVELATPL